MNTHKQPFKSTHPLPLTSILHDLALLRASDLDLASLLPASSSQKTEESSPPSDNQTAVDESVKRSIEFSREARAALKLLHSDAVDREGARVDEVRGRLEDVIKGLDDRAD